MSNTTFAVELQGLNLPDEVSNRLDAAFRKVVVEEIAKTDLSDRVSIAPLTEAERMLPFSSLVGTIRGYVAKLTERGGILLGPDTPFPPPRFPTPRPWKDPEFPPPFFGVDVVEALYYRPDIRAAAASNSRAVAELLGRDDDAVQAFNTLTKEAAGTNANGERLAAEIGIAVGAVLVGMAAGYLINKK